MRDLVEQSKNSCLSHSIASDFACCGNGRKPLAPPHALFNLEPHLLRQLAELWYVPSNEGGP